MGKAIIKTDGETTSITCIRCARGPISKMNSVIKDKLGNEWYCKCTKSDFKALGNDYHLDVFNDKGIATKKFLKGFLTFVREIGESEPEITEQVTNPLPPIKSTTTKVKKELTDDINDYEVNNEVPDNNFDD
jgi:hypothetical protein